MSRSWRIMHALRGKPCGTPESICGTDVVPPRNTLQNLAISVGAFRRLCGQSYSYSLPCAVCAEKLSLKVRDRTYGL